MDLTTQCPRCGTTFLASLDQLQLRKGYIRCVQCAHIFDGYEAVVPGDGPRHSQQSLTKASEPESAPSPGPEPEAPRVGFAADTLPEPHFDIPEALPAVVRQRREFTISDPVRPTSAHREPTLGAYEPDTDNEPFTATDTPRIAASRPVHRELDSMEMHRAGQWEGLIRAAWLSLIVLGLVLLLAQLAYVFRVQIAEQLPQLRPALESMCERLNCRVAYARHPDLILITQSSLQLGPAATTEEDAPGAADAASALFTLQLTLRNAYDKPQEWPVIVLDLKDASGALIARKNLPADVYLPADVAARPFPGSSERAIRLPLTLHGLSVNGYQLTTFFP